MASSKHVGPQGTACVRFQGSRKEKSTISLHRSLNLQIIHTSDTLYYYPLPCITTYYLVFIPSAIPGAVQYAEAPVWHAHQLCSDLMATLEGPDEGNGGLVFVQEVGHLLCKVAQLHVPPEAHHVSVDGLLPLECSPAIAVSASTAKIVGNFAPPYCTNPNFCPDSAGHAPSRCISLQQLVSETFSSRTCHILSSIFSRT